MTICATKKPFFLAACIAWVACFGVDAAPTHTAPTPEGALQLQCGAPFRDNVVLQQKIKLPVWGECQPGARVTIRFEGQTKSTLADKDGVWRLTLDPMNAVKLKSVHDNPPVKTMTIACEKGEQKETKLIRNLLVGEVWLCAGQSNMAGRMGRAGSSRHFPPDSIDTADFPALRQMVSPKQEWLVCTPESAVWFKKVCFFFARRLQSEILVPVGIINAASGGSKIESWLNEIPGERGRHYDAMIAPLEGFGLRGALWYQGESNERDGRAYQPKLESLITGWRKAWGQGDFPVYFVQLPGIGKSSADNPAGGDGRAEIREAYAETLALLNTGMAVTIDIGDLKEHPPNKYDTGVRLACLALKHTYEIKDTALSPLYRKHKIEGPVVRIGFDHAEDGLMVARKEGFLPPKVTPGAQLQWLSVQSKDGIWHWAEGRIEGSQLLVSSKSVNDPVAVRYAYTQHPIGNLLYGKGGQPVGPFSTNGYGTKTVPENKK
jgi:sialate O-acetylesterase